MKENTISTCFLIAGYCTVLIFIVFITEFLQSNEKGSDTVYAMTWQNHTVNMAVDEKDGLKSKEEDWWRGSIHANLENVLRNSMHKYMQADSATDYDRDSKEEVIVERYALLSQNEMTGDREGQAYHPASLESGLLQMENQDTSSQDSGSQDAANQGPSPQEPHTQVMDPSEPSNQPDSEPTSAPTGQPSSDPTSEPNGAPPQESNNKKADKKSSKSKKTAKKKKKNNKKASSKKRTNKKKTRGKTSKIVLSKEERNVLLRIVEAEATGEDLKGKMLVANVVLNRVKSKRFPNTVKKVVFQSNGKRHQFSPISDGRYWKVRISKQTRKAVERVLNGEDDSKGALYFMSRKYAKPKNIRWFDSSLTRLYQYGVHEFYK